MSGPQVRSGIVIPELDVLLRAFSRHDPEPGVVALSGELIAERRLFLVGWVRQGLLTRCRDERQFARLLAAVAPFPDIPIQPADHVAAAALTRELDERSISIQPAQALLWAMAERIGGSVWSRQTRWRKLERYGAPLYRDH